MKFDKSYVIGFLRSCDKMHCISDFDRNPYHDFSIEVGKCRAERTEGFDVLFGFVI